MKYVVNEPKQIKPNRYLFHVSPESCREGIKEKGLLVSCYGKGVPCGVYAHNLLTEPNWTWYPFFLDYQDWTLDTNIDLKLCYDYWRIDTQKVSNRWFIDFVARNDFGSTIGQDPGDMYVYSDEYVPVEALQLFKFQKDRSWEFKGTPGAYHYRGIGEFRPFVE
jgi:hypothetical protein